MVNGKIEHMNQSSSLEIEVDEQTVQKLREMSDGDSADIDVTVIRGYASSPEIYVAPPFKKLEVEGMNHDVEIVSGVPENKMVKPNTKISVKVTVRVEDDDSAIHQE
jgi:hypothetical protein